jgi:hypothetical protein
MSRNIILVLIMYHRHKLLDIIYNIQIKDEMGGECSTIGGQEECMYDIDGKARRKETARKIKTYVGG